jgi:hypothetical protein
MKDVTKEMIKIFKLKKLGCDFMGYEFVNPNELSFHHLVIANRDGGLVTIDNGAILKQKTSHDYIHVIEMYDPEIFYLITSEMIDENIKGYLDIKNLRKIRDLLEYFEREYCSTRTNNGKLLIKREYLTDRIKL